MASPLFALQKGLCPGGAMQRQNKKATQAKRVQLIKTNNKINQIYWTLF
jgi:hypothetical protein